MDNRIRNELLQMSDQKYSEFSGKLIPDSKPLIGVRLPALRTYAKRLVKEEDWRALAQSTQQDAYFEETMLRGMLTGYGSSKTGEIKDALDLLDEFVPRVDNWSVCDSCCVSFTLFQKHRESVYEHIQKYLYSDREFEVRVGLILLLDHFLKCDENGEKMPRRRSVEVEDLNLSKHAENVETGKAADMYTEVYEGKYTERILNCLNRPFTQGYYAMMAAAWLTAECFVTFPERTYAFLTGRQAEAGMDQVTYNKALQKICESTTPSDEVKEMIRALKVK